MEMLFDGRTNEHKINNMLTVGAHGHTRTHTHAILCVRASVFIYVSYYYCLGKSKLFNVFTMNK